MLAGKGKSQALQWLQQARTMLKDYADAVEHGTIYPYKTVMDEALLAHFHIAVPLSSSPDMLAKIRQIAGVYDAIEGKFGLSATIFLYKSRADATAAGFTGAPAFGTLNTAVHFTPDFVAQGPLGRAAMVLHETVHVIDSQSFVASTHIPEWYVTDAEADRLGFDKALTSPPRPTAQFATRYNEMSTANSLHNPSSYAAMAQHVFYGRDTRYGAGRPNQ